MKKPLIHLGTRIQVSFCIPDENGNAGQTIPVNLEVRWLNRQVWLEAFDLIEAEREKILAQMPTAQLANGEVVIH